MSHWIEHKPLLLRAYTSTGILSIENVNKEFRGFVAKYEKKIANSPVVKKNNERIDDDLPCNSNGVPEGGYNKFYSGEVRLKDVVSDKYLLREVSRLAIDQFEFIVALYLKFRNVRRFKKLKALKDCQASLPIASSRDEIIQCLTENQVLIIAGDTGCGKSTQVTMIL
ncbi:putative ATP-dependent RNA helicase DHX34 [Ditylenchus destructor]|nr:putative ATP-dependent RNA helicase DHX34 [Ditylenchus destructor]